MKTTKLFTITVMAAATAALSPAAASVTATTAAQDSVYILAYTTTQDEGRSGLRYAWSRDGKAWTSIGGGRSFLRCDYGLWGGEKRMLRPCTGHSRHQAEVRALSRRMRGPRTGA